MLKLPLKDLDFIVKSAVNTNDMRRKSDEVDIVQRVFLSYSFASHPDYADQLHSLETKIRRVIDAMGLRVVDGVNFGGAPLEEAIVKRIHQSDALIALFTPQAGANGEKCEPQYVASEFQCARAANKPTFRVQHTDLAHRGLGSGDEHVMFSPATQVDVVMKVLQTLSLWKSEKGRPVQIKIAPDDLVERYDDKRDRCEYQLLLAGNAVPEPVATTTIVPEPGAAYVYVPNFVDGARVRVRLTVGGEEWRSHFVLPQMGGVALNKTGQR